MSKSDNDDKSMIVVFNIDKSYVDMIDKYVKNNPDLYNSRSHFIRACVIKQLKKE